MSLFSRSEFTEWLTYVSRVKKPPLNQSLIGSEPRPFAERRVPDTRARVRNRVRGKRHCKPSAKASNISENR